MDTLKMIESVQDYITELESFRPPIKRPITLYPFNVSSKRSKRSYFIRNNPKLHEKIQKELDPYYKNVVKITFKDITLFFGLIILIALSGTLFSIIYSNNLIKIITGSINTLIFIYFLFWIYKNYKNAGKKYDEEIKKSVQELIDYGNEYIKENNLNPQDYPLKLRHNDYKGLKYEEKDKNSYMAYL